MEHYDIIIIGGGVAGLCAAIQAARGGARTLLVEKNGMPGGTMTMSDVAVPGLFGAWGRQIIAGIGLLGDKVQDFLKVFGSILQLVLLQAWQSYSRSGPFPCPHSREYTFQ